MRIFKTRWMARYARHEKIADSDLVEAIRRAERGQIDADLGGGVIKQRIGRPGQGRSGGYRTLIAFKLGDRAFFVFAFAKNRQDNVERNELAALRIVASQWLKRSDQEIAAALDDGRIEEVGHGNQAETDK